MALIPTVYSAALLVALGTQGYNGSKLSDLCTAIGTGVIGTILGETGSIATPVLSGVSAGIGITVSGTNIGSKIRTTAKSLFGNREGTELLHFADIIGNITASQLALATLTSDANGTAAYSNFLNDIDAMASAIQNAAPSFTGPEWPHFCTAIATGICKEIGNNGSSLLSGALVPPAGTGTVIIS